MTKLRTFCIFLVMTSLVCRVKAQQRSFISFRNYNQQDGLSSYNITKIIQDQYGFVWIGTQDGINCFDGTNFLIFNKESPINRRLTGNNITDMVEDSAASLIWAATSLGGVVAINTRTQTLHTTLPANPADPRLKDVWIHSLCLCGDQLWIGAYGALLAFNKVTGIYKTLDPGLLAQVDIHSLNVSRLLCDRAGRIWAFCDGLGVLILSGTTGKLLFRIPAKRLNFFASPKDLHFWGAFDAAGQDIYMATNWGLRRISYNSTGNSAGIHVRSSEGPDFFYNDELFAGAMDADHRIWFSNASGLFRWDPAQKSLDRIFDANQESDSWQSTIYALYSDSKGFIWAGSEEGLSILHRRKQPFDKFYHSFSSGSRIQHAFTLYPLNDSITYCGAGNGLYRVNMNNRLITQIDNAGSCYMIDEIGRKQLIGSNSKGLFTIIGDHLVPASRLYPWLAPIQHELLCASLRYNDSIMVFASQLQKGIFVCNTKSKKISTYNSGNSALALGNNVVNALFKDSRGRLWVLSINTVFLFDPITGSCQTFHITDPATRQPCGILFDICETKNSFWLAGYGTGLIETDKQLHFRQIISIKEGLSNNGVYKVFHYHDSLVLITSNNGLSVFDIADHLVRNYYAPDGLQSNSFEQFCGANDGDRIYAGGVNGFTRIDPAFFRINKVPPDLYISRVKIDLPSGSLDTTNMSLGKLTVPNNALQTTVYFSILDYELQKNAVIEYKILELNGDWIRLYGQRFVNLIGLSPGIYTLQVRSANADGYWSVAKELELRFLPKWYQTLIFKLFVIAAVGFLLYAFYRYRIGQIKKQQQIRKDIASDLHDDIGSTLNTVKIFTHLAKREQHKEEYLTSIEESLTQASMGLRDMIWILDDSLDTVRELAERIKKFAVPVTQGNNIIFKLVAGDDISDRVLSKTVKRNLLMIAKESITNSLKYSEAGNITVLLKQDNGKLVLSILDDGKGFDTQRPSAGNGLKNIRQRSKQIHFSALIISAPGKGAEVRISEC